MTFESSSGSLQAVGAQSACVVLLIVNALTSMAFTQTFTAGEKGKVKGTIMSRELDAVKVQADKTGSIALQDHRGYGTSLR